MPRPDAGRAAGPRRRPRRRRRCRGRGAGGACGPGPHRPRVRPRPRRRPRGGGRGGPAAILGLGSGAGPDCGPVRSAGFGRARGDGAELRARLRSFFQGWRHRPSHWPVGGRRPPEKRACPRRAPGFTAGAGRKQTPNQQPRTDPPEAGHERDPAGPGDPAAAQDRPAAVPAAAGDLRAGAARHGHPQQPLVRRLPLGDPRAARRHAAAGVRLQPDAAVAAARHQLPAVLRHRRRSRSGSTARWRARSAARSTPTAGCSPTRW